MGRDPERGGMGFSRSEATIRALVRRSVGPYVCNAFAFRPTRGDLCRVYGLVFTRTSYFYIAGWDGTGFFQRVHGIVPTLMARNLPPLRPTMENWRSLDLFRL